MHKNFFIKKDNRTEVMNQFIKKYGGKPINPDILDRNFEFYSSDKFGKLGERYIKYVFRDLQIKKIKASEKPTPDFNILINEKDYKLEVKNVSDLYSTIWGLFGNIYENEKKDIQKIIETIYRGYDISITPFEIHMNDEKNFKAEILPIIKNFDLNKNEIKTKIKCPKETYKIEINKKKKIINGSFSVSSGWMPKQTNTLRNVIWKNKKQIGKCDILSIILLNDSIDFTDLKDFFYKNTQQCLFFWNEKNKENKDMSFFNQYDLDKTIWGVKFKNDKGELRRIGDKLKCIIIFYPEKMNAFVFPSVKLFDDFSGIEYTILKKVIKAKGFDLYFATYEVNKIQA